MPSPADSDLSSDLSSDPEVLAARGKVELAKAELESRLYQAGDSGKRALARMARKSTPIIVTAVVAIGTLALIRLVRSRRSRPVAWQMPVAVPREPSLFKVALGAALRAAVRVLATRAIERAAARLVEKTDEAHDFDERDERNALAQ